MLRHLSAVGAAVVGLVGLASTPLVNAAACTTTSVSNSKYVSSLVHVCARCRLVIGPCSFWPVRWAR